jgi:uncharacterized coiled-coil protein SlyX
MKKAVEIKSEIDKTDSRITELETQLTAQTTTFEGVQQAFIAGKADSDELHAEQSKLTLVSQAVEALKTTYQKLKSAFERQSIEERRGELLKQMTDAANAVEPRIDDYRRARSEFGLIAAQHAEILVAKAEKYRAKQIEFQSIVRELQLTTEQILELGIEQKTLTMAATGFINHPPIGIFTEAVALAENLLMAKLDKQAASKRIVEAKARQAAMSATNAGISKNADSALLEV